MRTNVDSLAEFHAGHDCNPGKCQCKCGCETQIGCRAYGELCSLCHMEAIYDESEHGFFAPETYERIERGE